uniref:Uncharacterized protein n=1 Tax=Opuntia streptacantha TaxID=393608 RepID=A0A7C9DXR9_OPUST
MRSLLLLMVDKAPYGGRRLSLVAPPLLPVVAGVSLWVAGVIVVAVPLWVVAVEVAVAVVVAVLMVVVVEVVFGPEVLDVVVVEVGIGGAMARGCSAARRSSVRRRSRRHPWRQPWIFPGLESRALFST